MEQELGTVEEELAAAGTATAPAEEPQYTDPDDSDLPQEVTPSWVTEGTADDEDTIGGGEDLSGLKEREPMAAFIPAAKGVLFEIKSAIIDTIEGKDAAGNKTGIWKFKMFKVQANIVSGIVYKDSPTPKYAGKPLFPRMFVAYNSAGPYDFSTSKAGKPTTYWSSNDYLADYASLLKALGFDTHTMPVNNKAFRASLVGRRFIADIEVDTNRETKVKENALYKYRPAPTQL